MEQNNIFIPIVDIHDVKHYVNPRHIIDINQYAPAHCQIYLTHGKSFTTKETAVSIIEKILVFNGQAKHTDNNTK